jgi:hypothetical protein
MTTLNEKRIETGHHCAYCGLAVNDDMPPTERFGERFCSEAHAEDFASGARAARMRVAAQSGSAPASCAMAAAGQRTWKDYLKRGACWGAPLLLLLAIPLFWSGSAAAATGGSILSALALLACPLGMYFMMRAMGGMNHGPQDHAKGDADNKHKESPK